MQKYSCDGTLAEIKVSSLCAIVPGESSLSEFSAHSSQWQLFNTELRGSTGFEICHRKRLSARLKAGERGKYHIPMGPLQKKSPLHN